MENLERKREIARIASRKYKERQLAKDPKAYAERIRKNAKSALLRKTKEELEQIKKRKREYMLKYHKEKNKNLTEEEKNKRREYLRSWREKQKLSNPEKFNKLAQKWRLENADKHRLYVRNCYAKKKERIKQDPKLKEIEKEKNTTRLRIRRQTIPSERIKHNLRTRFKLFLKKALNQKTFSYCKIVGCSSKDLVAHLESLFTKKMNWSNYGTYWHIDHIIPVAAFDHTDEKQVRQCWHFSNLKPLTATTNRKKGKQITHPQMQLCI